MKRILGLFLFLSILAGQVSMAMTDFGNIRVYTVYNFTDKESQWPALELISRLDRQVGKTTLKNLDLDFGVLAADRYKIAQVSISAVKDAKTREFVCSVSVDVIRDDNSINAKNFLISYTDLPGSKTISDLCK